MPAKILRKTFCLQKSHDIDPAHTWVLDLTQPEAKIFAHMEKEKVDFGEIVIKGDTRFVRPKIQMSWES